MSKPNKHHYVPQCYLKRFSCDNKNIRFFDKSLDKCSCDEIEKFCQIENFYYLSQNTDPYYIETTFFANDIEDKLGKLLNFFDLIDTTDNKVEFNKDRRLKLSYQIVLQYLRIPKYRFMKSSTEIDLYLFQIRAILEQLFNFEVEEISFEGDDAEFHKNILLEKENIKKIANEISEASWELLHVGEGEFYSSDNPIVIMAREDMPVTYCDAIIYFDQIYYPINSNLLLHISAKLNKNFKFIPIREIDNVEVEEINSFVKRKAEKYIIYKNEFK